MNRSICHLTVRGYELDSFGHVNNAVYLQYAETAKWDFFRDIGLTENKDIFPIALENNIRYMHELKNFDEILIDTEWYCSDAVISFKHILKRISDNKAVCRVSGKMCLVNNERMIVDIPHDIKSRIGGKSDERI